MNFLLLPTSSHPGWNAHAASEGPVGGPALIFVNSLGSDLRIWDDVVTDLSRDHCCIRYDKRGHGLSEAVPPFDLGTQTTDLFDVLDAFEIESATVVGISVGGLIALSAALTRPERVESLILCDTAARIGSTELWEERIRDLEAQGLPAMAATIAERWFAADFGEREPAALRGYTTMLSRTSPAGYVGTCGLLRDSDLRGRVGSLTCPTLVVTGDEDVATPPEVGRSLAQSIPGARFAQIDGAGHLPCVEMPGQLGRVIRDFMDEVHDG